MLIAGLAVVVGALFYSLHELHQEENRVGKSTASSDVEVADPVRRPTSSILSVAEPVPDSSPEATTEDANVMPEGPAGIDVAPPVGSEAPVPAVFGLLAQSNVTDLSMAEGLQGIAEEFAEKVKQGGWDTTSEAYRTNWEKAAQEADDTLRARYGTEAFLRLKQNAAP